MADDLTVVGSEPLPGLTVAKSEPLPAPGPLSTRLPTASDAVAITTENARQTAAALVNRLMPPALPELSAMPMMGTSIGPAGPQSLGSKLQEAVIGGPHTGDTPIGRSVFHQSFEAPSEPHVPTTDLPMVRLGQFGPEAAEVLGNTMAPGAGPLLARSDVGQGIGKGAAELAEGLTTAPNALMVAGSGAMGLFGEVHSLLPRAISAYFSQDMLRNAYRAIPEVKQAWDAGDAKGTARALTVALGNTAMGVDAGLHAVHGGGAGAAPEEGGIARPAEEESGLSVEKSEPLPAEGLSVARSEPLPEEAAKLQQTAAGSEAGATNKQDLQVQPEPKPGEAEAKPLWEMSHEELSAEENAAKNRDKTDLTDLFGADGAQRYNRLERVANSAARSDQETGTAQDELDKMESSLSEDQRNRLYGIGDERPQVEEVRAYRQAVGGLNWDSPQALGDSLKWAVTGIGDKENPADMTQGERVRYAQLRYAMGEAAKLGWDPEEISRAALKGSADRFDEGDAPFMLRRFLGGEGSPVPERLSAEGAGPGKLAAGGESSGEKEEAASNGEQQPATASEEGRVGVPEEVGARGQGPGAGEEVKPPPFPETPPPLPADTSPIAPEEEGKRTAEASADKGTTLGAGLGAFEPFFKESMEEGNALRAKRKAAQEAIDARAGTPEQAQAGESLRQWYTGERDLWSTRVNQAIDRSSRMFTPDVKTREAVGMTREFAHRPGELQQFLDGSHPALEGADKDTLTRIQQLRPAMELALHPTPKMEKANWVYTNIAEKSLEEGKAGGWLGSRWQSDEYMPHLLNAEGEGAVPAPPADRVNLQGNIGKHFQFAAKRFDEYPTMLHAIADGKIPKTMDPADAFSIHGANFARARATHLVEAQMAEKGMGHWGTDEDAPKGWEPLAKHSDEFSKTGAGGMQRLYVPPFIQEALKPITDPEVSGRAFTAVRGAQRGLKEAILGLSGFHLLTENAMAASDMGPSGMYKAYTADRDSADFLKWERDAAAHGELTSIAGRTMDAYKNLAPGSIPTRGEILRAYAPGSKQALEIADHITKFTFDNVQRRFKVVSYMLHSMDWDNQNPHGTPAQRSLARQGIASYVNGTYGGLHWENMGRSRAFVETARMLFLAPDWTGSNLALGKYAVDAKPSMQEIPFRNKLAGAVDKTSVQARLSRAFWAKSIVGGLVGTQAMSLMLSGQLSKKPFMVYMGKDKDGKEVYSNMMFRGSAGDLVNLASKMVEHGLLAGAGVFLGGKAAPFVKAGMHLITGRDDFGREIAPKGLSPIANTARTVGQTVSDLSPIPITAKNAYKTMVGDEADKYSWTERALSLIGSPPQHVEPAKESAKPENSILDQIRTGQAHEVKHRKKAGQ